REGGAAESEASGGGAGDRGVAAGALRGACADGPGSPTRGAGPGPAVVHRDVEDPALSLAGGAERPMRRHRPPTLVRRPAGRGRRGGAARTTPPGQPARHQTQDEQLEEETAAASQSTSAQTLQGMHRHYLISGYVRYWA